MIDYMMLWWVWFAIAIGLAIVEILAPGFIFLGFAIGAGLTALLQYLMPLTNLPVLLVIFAASSLASWLVLRRIFALPTGQVKTFDHDIND